MLRATGHARIVSAAHAGSRSRVACVLMLRFPYYFAFAARPRSARRIKKGTITALHHGRKCAFCSTLLHLTRPGALYAHYCGRAREGLWYVRVQVTTLRPIFVFQKSSRSSAAPYYSLFFMPRALYARRVGGRLGGP